jgi:hypothetical protein
MNAFGTLVALGVVALGVACSGATGESVGDTAAADSSNNVTQLYTISYAPNSYVIGNAYPGWTDDLRGGVVKQGGPGNEGGAPYQCGFLFGESFDHCGWVDRSSVRGSAADTACGSECPGTYETSLFTPTYTNGTINPVDDDGSPTFMDWLGSGCTDHEGYGNVNPWMVPAKPANSRGTVEHGHFLLWRYVSKDSQWVLVRDPAVSSGDEPNWYFVQRGCVSLRSDPTPPPPLSSSSTPAPAPAPTPAPSGSSSSTPTPTPAPAPLHCCAKCWNRTDAYEATGTSGCKEDAINFCSVNDRGGVDLFYQGDCGVAP